VAVEHLEGQLIAPLLALGADKVHSEGGVDKAEAAETGFVLSHEALQGLEEGQGRESHVFSSSFSISYGGEWDSRLGVN